MIEVDNVLKRYGDVTALDRVSFTARSGVVTGFLGPNGAGKSTTMRVIAALTRPDQGTATIDGRAYADLANPGREVGMLLDASAQHAGRTGREILNVGALTMGLPRNRVDALLETVGLSAADADRRVRTYSLGMRQRLGVAHALLGSPETLVLDEPANGLDPAGIHWMRSLLRDHAARGGTVLLSSHLLHEVEAIADELVVIGDGRIVAQGTQRELLRQTSTVVRAERLDQLVRCLDGAGIEYRHQNDGSVHTTVEPAVVGRAALDAGVVLTELRQGDRARLEELFLELTTPGQRDGARDGDGERTAA